MKVTFCTYDKPDSVGGPFSWLQWLLPALQHRGIDVRCLFLLHWGDSGPGLEACSRTRIPFEAIQCAPRTWDQVRWILEQLRRDPPDVFVPNLPVAAYFAASWCRAAGIPTVGILHSDDSYYGAIQEEFVFGPEKFRLSALVCVSQQLETGVLQRKPPDTRIWRIPYGVRVAGQPRVSRSGGLRLAYVGRFAEEQKRISEVTRALCRAVKEVSGTTAVLYGDGPDRANVAAVLAAEGGGLPVTLGGLIPAERIQEKLQECDVLVLLSDYEGLPIAVMEAMACGCVPVCTSMRSGIAELVEHEVTGLIVEDRGAGFVKAIRRLAEEPGLYGRLSSAARQLVETRFSDTVCDQQWADMLRETASMATRQRRIPVSNRIALPRRHPALESEASRLKPPGAVVRLCRRGRILAGRIKRQLLGQPIP